MKREKKRIRRYLCLFLVCLCVGTVVYGAVRQEIPVTGRFRSGSVALDLNTYSRDGKVLRETVPEGAVTAGKRISYIPEITAVRADCYVRLRVTFDMKKKVPAPLTVSGLKLNKGWVRKGDQIYYTKPLKTGKSSCAFEEIIIPETWNRDTASDFTVHLTADAIQAEHFAPDFESDTPWGAVEIEEEKETDPNDYRRARPLRQEHSLTYQGNGIFELPSADLFSNFSPAAAGDRKKDCLRMKNDSGKKIRLSFRCTPPEARAFPARVRLELYVGERRIYAGPLSGERLRVYQNLADLKPGEEQMLRFELSVPERLRNRFSAEMGKVVWFFRAEEMERSGSAVQTGDAFPYILLILFLTGSGSTLILLCKRRKQAD